MIEQRAWSDGADNCVYACQSPSERYIIFDLADMNFNAADFKL
jgi:hypothetical protein